MKSCHFMLILLTMFSTLAAGQENPKIALKGIVRDQKSKMPLSAQIKIIYKDTQLEGKEITSKGDGSFELNTLQKNLILQAKANGYIVSNVVMNFENSLTSTVIAEIPLVLDSKPKSNQYIIEFAERKQDETSNKEPHNKQIFQAVDAVDGNIVGAKFRLISSDRSEIINTKTSIEESVFEHNFTKEDNILLEVTADGYQKFWDNIVIDKFDETVHKNTAKLIKNVSFLNLIIKNEAELQSVNIFENSTQKAIKISKSGDMYFGILAIDKHYKIKVNTRETGDIIKEFTALEGINQIIIILESKNKTQELAAKVVQVEKQAYEAEKKTINLDTQTLFFEQSSYILKPESKHILEEISKQLLKLPEVNIEITGYTDNIGDTRQNQYLSEFRAKVISSFLFNKGIKDNRIKFKGDGSKQANISNITEDNRQLNRKAELRFYTP